MTIIGVELGPASQLFDKGVRVTITLSEPTIATELPALMYDEESGQWVGTGENAVVLEGGTQARFDVDHFSLFGIPDLVLPPEEGDPIETFIVLSNDGVFESTVISSDNTALVYSEVGDTFNISLTSQAIGRNIRWTKGPPVNAEPAARNNTLAAVRGVGSGVR